MDETRHFRVVVRGQFADLDDHTRARLLADVADHDLFSARFTPDGFWVYDEQLVAFNVRFELRGTGPRADEEATALAEDRTRQLLDDHGVGYKRLRSTAADMQEMWR